MFVNCIQLISYCLSVNIRWWIECCRCLIPFHQSTSYIIVISFVGGVFWRKTNDLTQVTDALLSSTIRQWRHTDLQHLKRLTWLLAPYTQTIAPFTITPHTFHHFSYICTSLARTRKTTPIMNYLIFWIHIFGFFCMWNNSRKSVSVICRQGQRCQVCTSFQWRYKYIYWWNEKQ